MKLSTRLLGYFFLVIASIIAFFSCEYNSVTGPSSTDAELFDEITATSGFVYYDGGNLLAPASQSPHGAFKLRFNAVASAALDGNGELPAGSSFPTGSVIVKEVYNGGNLALFALAKKDPADPNAGSGWLWAELELSGDALYSVARKGQGCIPCHRESPHRDLIRTFDLH